MYWLNPTFSPIIVFALCMVLFGLLALSLANRKAARAGSPSSSASARQTAARPAHDSQPAYGSRQAGFSSNSSGLTLSITANYAPREEAKVVAESVAQLMAALNSPALRARKELVQDLPALPPADLASAAPSENEAPATESEDQPTSYSSPTIEELVSATEQQPVPDVADDPVLPLQSAAAEERLETESAVVPNFPALPSQDEALTDLPFSSVVDLTSSRPSENEVLLTPESEAEEAISSASPAIEQLGSGVEKQPTEVAASANTDATEDPAALQSTVRGERETDNATIAPAPEPLPVASPEKQWPTRNLLEFHGLRQQPFDVTPDPGYLYLSPSHREALTSLSLGIEHLRGFMTLVAEPGMGKTTLMNKLMAELADSARVVFLFQTQCSSSELLSFIMNELELDHVRTDVVSMHRALNQALLEQMLLGQRFVLIVDEAQNLQEPVLETIRLLSDFETTHSKLIQIILVGQPQLADTLMRPGLKQLRQRISVLTSLKPLDAAETAEYVEHRLHTAGGNGKARFTPEALTQIAELSKGIPRSINNLCFNAMLAAFADGKEMIDMDIVKGVAEKLNLEPLTSLQDAAATTPCVTQGERNGTEELVRVLAAALSTEARRQLSDASNGKPKAKSGVTVYIGEEAATETSKPIRIRIEND